MKKVATAHENEPPEERAEPTGEELLLRLMATRATRDIPSRMTTGLVLGTLTAIHADRQVPLVSVDGRPESCAVEARSLVPLTSVHVGKQVAILYEGNDSDKPIVIGVLNDEKRSQPEGEVAPIEVFVDGERLVVSARRQIVFKCGKASITLTESGKVLIQGEYVSTRATGVHRIKGGSVQIN